MVDVVGSYLALNGFLEEHDMEVVPKGDLLKVMDKAKRRAVFVGDTIIEVSDWVKETYNVRILVKGRA